MLEYSRPQAIATHRSSSSFRFHLVINLTSTSKRFAVLRKKTLWPGGKEVLYYVSTLEGLHFSLARCPVSRQHFGASESLRILMKLEKLSDFSPPWTTLI
jgi:hypothetical protein